MPAWAVSYEVKGPEIASYGVILLHAVDADTAVLNALVAAADGPSGPPTTIMHTEIARELIQQAIDATDDNPDDTKAGSYIGHGIFNQPDGSRRPVCGLWLAGESKEAVVRQLEQDGVPRGSATKVCRSTWSQLLPYARTLEEIEQHRGFPGPPD